MTGRTQWSTRRVRWIALVAVAAIALGGSVIYALQAYQRYQDRNSGVSAASVTEQLPSGSRIVFRNTASGEGYGKIAAVPLDDPHGPRGLGDVACDRVYAAEGLVSCMRIIRGIPTTFETQILDSAGRQIQAWSLPGIPSRTRISSDGLVATTAFVTGHSYATNSFSTETTIRGTDGRDYGNLENFRMLINGSELTAIDRNVWGVTFASDDAFFATVASGGKTWLVSGSLQDKTLTSVVENAECPSISPDGTRVAFKKRRAGVGAVHWDIAVLDLAAGDETQIPLERSMDDQIEWLDNDTMLFGEPREGAVGDSDILSLRPVANAKPQVFIEHAWSPSVER